MSRLIELVPFRFSDIKGPKQRYKIVAIKAAVFLIPFILVIYPMIWAHGVIYDLEMWMLTQVDTQSREINKIRDLNNEIKLLEDEMERKRSDTFILIRYLKNLIDLPYDNELFIKIGMLKVARDSAITALESVEIHGYINIVKTALEYFNMILLLYIWFISAKYYLYLLFRLAPSSGVSIVYTFPHSGK